MKALKYIVMVALITWLVANQVLISAAETEELEDACSQAQLDAQKDVSARLWFAIGFFGSIFGIVAAYVVKETPPASRLMGKPPEYVATYTNCYKRAAKEIQTKNASKGCVISGLLYMALYGCYYVSGLPMFVSQPSCTGSSGCSTGSSGCSTGSTGCTTGSSGCSSGSSSGCSTGSSSSGCSNGSSSSGCSS